MLWKHRCLLNRNILLMGALWARIMPAEAPNFTIVDQADCTSKCCIEDVEATSSSDSFSTHESRHFTFETEDHVFSTLNGDPPLPQTEDTHCIVAEKKIRQS